MSVFQDVRILKSIKAYLTANSLALPLLKSNDSIGESNVDISFKEKELSINGHKMKFHDPIETVLDAGNGAVVLLIPKPESTEQNIFFINPDGSIKWQIQHKSIPNAGYQGYTSVRINADGSLEAMNALGSLCRVDMETGKVHAQK